MKKIILVTAASLFAAGCAAGQAKEGAEAAKPGPETIAFDFDWPDEMVSEVDFERAKLTRAGSRDVPWQGKSSFTLRVEREDETQFEVRTEDLTFEFEGRANPGTVIQGAMNTGMPSLTVAEVGDLVGLNGTAAILDAYAQSAEVDLAGLPENVRAQVDSLRPQISQAIDANARLLWTNIVGFWAGREIQVGETVDRRGSLPVAALGGQQVTNLMSYKILGRVACDVDVEMVAPELPPRPEPPAEEMAAEAGEGAEEMAAEAGEGAEEMAAEAGEGAEETAAAAEEGAEETGAAAEEGAGEMVAEAGEGAAETAVEAGEGVGETAAEAGEGAGEVAAAGAEGAAEAAEAAAGADDRWSDPADIPGLGQGQCVWIEVHSGFDPETVRQAVANAGDNAQITDLVQNTSVVVVTDPKGLKPHRVRRVSTTLAEVPGQGTQGEEDSALWIFDYPTAE